MNIPTNCPYCNDILNTTFHESNPISSVNIIYKTCEKRIDHWLRFMCYDNTKMKTESVETIKFRIAPNTIAEWDLKYKLLDIRSPKTAPINLRYFEPDLSDLKKLKLKMKIYILFS